MIDVGVATRESVVGGRSAWVFPVDVVALVVEVVSAVVEARETGSVVLFDRESLFFCSASAEVVVANVVGGEVVVVSVVDALVVEVSVSGVLVETVWFDSVEVVAGGSDVVGSMADESEVDVVSPAVGVSSVGALVVCCSSVAGGLSSGSLVGCSVAASGWADTPGVTAADGSAEVPSPVASPSAVPPSAG